MKKIISISLIGILAVMPMMAGAATGEPVAGEPVAGDSDSPAASSAPKYALALANSETDNKVATGGYVKGAYNAAIKGVNALQQEIDTANAALDAVESDLQDVQDRLDAEYATTAGVAATVNSASTSGSFSNATVSGTFSNATISGSLSGSATGTIPALTTWGDDNTTGTAPATASFSNTSVTGSASGSMTGTASGTTSGTVSVNGYSAS